MNQAEKDNIKSEVYKLKFGIIWKLKRKEDSLIGWGEHLKEKIAKNEKISLDDLGEQLKLVKTLDYWTQEEFKNYLTAEKLYHRQQADL